MAEASREAAPHPVQLGGHPLGPDNAGEHVLAVPTHVVLDPSPGPRRPEPPAPKASPLLNSFCSDMGLDLVL